MPTRTINIALTEQTPQARTLLFIPQLTPLTASLLLNTFYSVTTAADGTGSIDLPTLASGTIRYDYRFPRDGGGYSTGYFLLDAGSAVDLETIITTNGAATDTVEAYVAANAVLKTGDQTVAGVKTFASSPIVPTPTTDYQAATKKYVDDNAVGSPTGYAIRITPNVDRFGQGGNNFNCGQFYLANTNYGNGTIEAWTKPLNGADYWFSEGQGGAHSWLIGFNGAATGNLGIVGAVWDATNSVVQYVSSVDTVPPNTVHHVMMGYDGTYLYAYLDGVLTDRVAYTHGRTSGDGVAYWGGSDHSNFNGWIFRGRIFEGVIPFTDGTMPVNYFFPEKVFRSTFNITASPYKVSSSLNLDFTVPASVVPDTSSGFNGMHHPAVGNSGHTYAHVDQGSGYALNYLDRPPFEQVAFEQGAYAGLASVTPVGAVLYDDFRRLDTTPAWQNGPTFPVTIAPTGQSWSANCGVIGNEKLFIWANGIGDRAYIDTGITDMDVTFTNGNTAAIGGPNRPQPYIRYTDNNNYIGANVQNFGGPLKMVVFEVNAGVYSTLFTSGDLGVGAQDWTTYRFVVRGTTLDVYRNSTLVCNGATTTVTTGTKIAIDLGPLGRLDKVAVFAS